MAEDFKIQYKQQIVVLADIIQIRDFAFTQYFAENMIKNEDYTSLRWPVSMSGEHKDRPFGYLKAFKKAEGDFILQMFVYPIDYAEFCQLIGSLNDYTQHQLSTP